MATRKPTIRPGGPNKELLEELGRPERFTPKPFVEVDDDILGRRIVDVSEKKAIRDIVREGFRVPKAKFDPTRFDDFIGKLPTPPKSRVVRVISQSIPAGRDVPAGTAVDLLLSPPADLPLDLFTGVHADLKGRKVSDLTDQVLDNDDIRSSVLKHSLASEVPAEEKTRIVEKLRTINVTVDDANSEKSFEKAFATLRNAAAFW